MSEQLDIRELLKRVQSYKKRGASAQASSLFRRTLIKHPTHEGLVLHAALHFMQVGNNTFARDLLSELLKRNPESVDGLKCLAMTYMQEGVAVRAVSLLKKARSISNYDSEVISNLCMALFQAGDYAAAEEMFDELFTHNPNCGDKVRFNYGLLLMALKKHGEAARFFGDLIESRELDGETVLTNLVACHLEDGSVEHAAPLLEKLFFTHFGNLYSATIPDWVAAITRGLIFFIILPPIFDSLPHYECTQKSVDQGFADMQRLVSENSKELHDLREYWAYLLLRVSNFHMGYLLVNDVKWGTAFSALSRALIGPESDYVFEGADNPTSSPRILLISQYWGLHATRWIIDLLGQSLTEATITIHSINGNYSSEWLDALRKRYDVYEFTLDEKNYKEYVSKVRKMAFDWVIFPDVGMTPLSRFLANFRLGRRQAVHWAHPVTTGSKNIDYFISAEGMEASSNPQANYSEQLISLPNFGLWLPNRQWSVRAEEIDEICRQRNDRSKRVRICSIQSLWKYLPHYDWMWLNILKSTPENFYLSFICLEGEESSARFRRRLLSIIHDQAPNSASRLEFVHRMTRQSYLRYLTESFFNVDSYGWSGGNTFIDACDVLLPTLTVRTDLMRGNHSAAGLITARLSNLVQESPNTYPEVLVSYHESPDTYKGILKTLAVGRDNLLADSEITGSFRKFITRQ